MKMKRSGGASKNTKLLVGLLLVVVGAACAPSIGDSCASNIDCTVSGATDRICDTTQVEGYCTVQGCDATSCPEGSVCVAFFPTDLLQKTCDPALEDAVDPALAARDDCLPQETCLSGGVCALRSQGTRFCMERCEEDEGCRPGYSCRTTGALGAEMVLDPAQPDERSARFCAQTFVALQ